MADDETRTEQEQAEAPKAPSAPTPPAPPAPPRPSDIAALMEKVFLMGAGAASLTKEKIDEFTNDLVERGRTSKGEAKEVADWMTEQAKRQAAAVESTWNTQSTRAADEAGVATKKDIESLQEQILELKSMIASSRGQSPG